jgi:tRNA pseudouridine55 synthase
MSSQPTAGILNIDKPYGITSMDVVRRVKRASGFKRVGHGGTLDPVATGVIPICIGQATRMMEYMLDGSKKYRTTIVLGVTTDTYDSQGEVTATADASHLTQEDVESALSPFLGEIEQVPPMYSALKKDGKRLYELARQGIEIEREPRPVSVYEIKLTQWKPPEATVEIHCGRGFYVRSLAYDLGQALGCGGHLTALVRLKASAFTLDEALTLEEAEESFEDGSWTEHLHSPDIVLGHMRAIIAGQRLQELIKNGRPIPASIQISPNEPEERCRVYGTDGTFLAIMRFDPEEALWKADKVFLGG